MKLIHSLKKRISVFFLQMEYMKLRHQFGKPRIRVSRCLVYQNLGTWKSDPSWKVSWEVIGQSILTPPFIPVQKLAADQWSRVEISEHSPPHTHWVGLMGTFMASLCPVGRAKVGGRITGQDSLGLHHKGIFPYSFYDSSCPHWKSNLRKLFLVRLQNSSTCETNKKNFKKPYIQRCYIYKQFYSTETPMVVGERPRQAY